MNLLYNIPEHKNCKNCGECCGRILVTPDEFVSIKKYVDSHASIKSFAINQSKKQDCPFRDNVEKKCLIYSVRPMICRLFGVADGMICLNGNTDNISQDIVNSLLQVDKYTFDDLILLNEINWSK